jgi:hypothetical protein
MCLYETDVSSNIAAAIIIIIIIIIIKDLISYILSLETMVSYRQLMWLIPHEDSSNFRSACVRQ